MKLVANKTEAGQSLVEAVIALGVAVIVIVALINLSLIAIHSATAARNQLAAKNLANQGLEIVRSLRDQSWSYLPEEKPGPYYLTTDKSSLGGTEEKIDQPPSAQFFTREIYIKDPEADKKQITCVVTWQDSSGQQQVSVSTFLTNWRQ